MNRSKVAEEGGSTEARRKDENGCTEVRNRGKISSYINAGNSSVLRPSVQPFSSFLRASVLSPDAGTFPSFLPPTFVHFLTFLYWHLSLFFTLLCHLFFILRCHLLIFINSCAFSYCHSFLLPDVASGRNVINSTLWCSTVCCYLNYYTSILFLLHTCRNFFCFAAFRAAILVFSARFAAASCCCNFAFCSNTYVRHLSHLSLLAFFTFVVFTLRCHLLFILSCHLFF